MPLTLSIDVGTRNLGVAVVDVGRNAVVDFELLCCCTIKKPTIERACRGLRETLDTYIDGLDLKENLEVCIIEAQPRRNMRTKVLSHVIQCIAETRGMRARFVSPKLKLKTKYKKYKDRKKAAVRIANRILMQTSPALYTKFKALKKKDDVADAILQSGLTPGESLDRDSASSASADEQSHA